MGAWILLAPALIAVPFLAVWAQKRWPHLFRDDMGPDGPFSTDRCPRCNHSTGVEGGHCADVAQVGGWTADACTCEDEYHWRVA